MTRPRKIRSIWHRPKVTYYKPQGIPLRYLEETILSLDEVEAIRLKEVEGLEQTTAAKKMKISQSTFQRILSSAHQKIAQALLGGKAIRFEGGSVKMEERIRRPKGRQRRFKCEDCQYQWNVPFGTGRRGIDMSCPKCKSGNIHRLDYHGHGFGQMPWGRKRRQK